MTLEIVVDNTQEFMQDLFDQLMEHGYTAKDAEKAIKKKMANEANILKIRNTAQLLKAACESAQVDEVQIYKQKTPLQRVVQILKRHRDQMFVDNQDSKPISVIITTLSARAYTGASSLELALKDVINGLMEFVQSDSNQVLNPVNPQENFADRWAMPAYKHLELKQNFHLWVYQVNRDFEFILSSNELELISESIGGNLAVTMEKSALSSMLAIPFGAEAAHTTHVVSEPVSKPWSKGRGEICK